MVPISKEKKMHSQNYNQKLAWSQQTANPCCDGTSWDRSLEPMHEEVLKEALMSSEKNKTATTKKTLKPFLVPSHLTFSFLPDSDF